MSSKESIYYVYIYLNPLKPGKYTYGDFISFQFEPFYVGMGKNGRIFDHLREKRKNTHNNLKFYIIQKIINSKYNIRDYITKLEFNCFQINAFEIEKALIKIIGRRDLKLGPLTNHTPGGEGRTEWTIKQRKMQSNKLKNIPKSEAHKKKLSESRLNMSLETRAKCRVNNTGKGNPSYGKRWITKENITKLVKKEIINLKLLEGWHLGRN